MVKVLPNNVHGEFMNICEEGCSKCEPILDSYEDGAGDTIYILFCKHSEACWFAFNKGLEERSK